MGFLRAVLLFLIFIFFIRCSQEVNKDEMIVFFQNKKATWIQDKKALPATDAEFYLDDPAPLFRKTLIWTNSWSLFSEIMIKEPEFFVTQTSSPRLVLRITVFKFP